MRTGRHGGQGRYVYAERVSNLHTTPAEVVRSSERLGWSGPLQAAERDYIGRDGAIHLRDGMAEHVLSVQFGSGAVELLSPSLELSGMLSSGDVVLHPAREGFECGWRGISHRCLHVLVAPGYVAQVADRVGAPALEFPTRVARRPVVTVELARLVHRELAGEGYGSRLVRDTLALALALELMQSFATSPFVPSAQRGGLGAVQLKRAVEHLLDGPGAPVTLEDLATDAGLSRYHFCRQFRIATGLSPHQYQLRARVERAQLILRTRPARPLSEVALECGFSDQSHFTRVFRRVSGVTPGRYRRVSAAALS